MHYQNEVVALHDIGVVSFFTNIKFVDLMGLTHLEVGGVLKNASLTTKKIAEIIQKNDCKIAIVYEELYQREYDLLPKNWHKVGSWQIKNNVMFHENRFSFYALKKKEIPILRDKLRVYSQCLSPTVVAEFVINDAPGLKNN
jgi:hypothetical protein